MAIERKHEDILHKKGIYPGTMLIYNSIGGLVVKFKCPHFGLLSGSPNGIIWKQEHGAPHSHCYIVYVPFDNIGESAYVVQRWARIDTQEGLVLSEDQIDSIEKLMG